MVFDDSAYRHSFLFYLFPVSYVSYDVFKLRNPLGLSKQRTSNPEISISNRQKHHPKFSCKLSFDN